MSLFKFLNNKGLNRDKYMLGVKIIKEKNAFNLLVKAIIMVLILSLLDIFESSICGMEVYILLPYFLT